MNVQLGNVPDGWLEKLKKKAEEEDKKNMKPPKEVYKPDIIWIKPLHAWLHQGPDYLSEINGELPRNQEVKLLEKRGNWLGVRDPKSGKEGWINQTDTTERKIDWSKMDQLRGCPNCPVRADEAMEGGRG